FEYPDVFEVQHDSGKPLSRTIRALPPKRDQLRCESLHPQVRRRTVHAASHCGSGQRAISEQDPRDTIVSTGARNHGVKLGVDPARIEGADMATVLEPKPLTAADFKGKVDPDWCPGCGDFGVLSSLQKVLAEMNISPYNVVTISGIGCSSNLPGFIDTYGMHTLHGRALAVATGVKMANHKLHVVVTGGDGDGFGIGGNHFI